MNFDLLPTALPPNIDDILIRCKGAYSQNTLRGYRNDLRHFQQWCEAQGKEWLPAEPETIARFIDEEAKTKAMATVKHRLDAISFAHMIADLPRPTGHSEVRLAVRRAKRRKSTRQQQVLGLTKELLDRMLEACPDTRTGKRDAALLSVGYDTLCRSSELVLLRVEHLSPCRSRLLVPRSKNDQFGEGRAAYLSEETAKRLDVWLSSSEITEGPLFQGLHTRKLAKRPFVTASVRRIVKRAAERASLTPPEIKALSGHSMRVGAAQDMFVAGFETLGIMQAGGWKSQNVLARYVEHASTQAMHLRRWKRLSEIHSEARMPAQSEPALQPHYGVVNARSR
ncbi:tyrosine-type recombinase/integrase [Qipengyuania gaetbuli]|uniref:tyrosine-type recombinase/integrase n=1 Tax=Qipengyuania gaetbuli TaxID=266952 RepID=UPI001CD3362F|nr:tyrosine-type recombinase/integrase [Qipengyuania gaetbuli]MCA0911040.1 site-specific integrase [Qipengyuania gaetbuli]